MDTRTGQLLAASNPNLELAPASLVKMMTFDLALRALKNGTIQLNESVPLGPGVRKLSLTLGISHMYLDLPPGATVPFKTLMLGMMVASGNDAALAVAEYVGGTDAHFVAMMNAEAAKLGMAHTHFANPEGLAAPGQVTTALDMATLARHIVLTYPTVYREFTDVATFRWQHITFRNYNHLIGVDAAVTGMKSGYWGGVGYHLVTTAIQGHTELVGVVLGTSGLQVSAQVSQGLLNWGFAQFQDVQISWQRPLPPHGTRVWGAKAPSVALRVTAQPWVVVPRTAQPAVPVTSAHLPPYLVAPVHSGQTIGSVQATLAGHVIASAPVVAAAPDPAGGLLTRAWGGFRLWLKHL
jgi:D-alanyl-D-alanine carboxypeptidase (penicillin-binding protein 5/6)